MFSCVPLQSIQLETKLKINEEKTGISTHHVRLSFQHDGRFSSGAKALSTENMKI
jgi:hypothetical protein